MLSWFQAFLDLLYPPLCPSCKRTVAVPGEWCKECFSKWCHWTCVVHQEQSPVLKEVYALSPYEGIVRHSLRQLKFHGKKSVVPSLRFLLQTVPQNWLKTYDVIVPIPLHPKRQQERGFNQVELLFKEWSKQRGLRYEELLVRTKATEYNWNLSLQDRKANLTDAFSLNDALRRTVTTNSAILLVDDIFTSGITLTEAGQVLRSAGFTEVGGLALAAGRVKI